MPKFLEYAQCECSSFAAFFSWLFLCPNFQSAPNVNVLTDVPVIGIASGTIVVIGVLRKYDECNKAMPKKAHEASLVEH